MKLFSASSSPAHSALMRLSPCPPAPPSVILILSLLGVTPLLSGPSFGPHALVSVFCFYTPLFCPAHPFSKPLLTAEKFLEP